MGNCEGKTLTEEEKYNLDPKDPFLNSNAYPRKDLGSTITLRDDRKLGYMIYGSVNHYKATIMFLPGSPGCRLFNYEPHNTLNTLHGIRCCVIDRPGIGLSSPHQKYTFHSHAEDIFELVSYLNLKSYHLVAYSAGVPFANVYASKYSNHSEYNLQSLQIISGVGPPDTPSPYNQMTFVNKCGWFLVTNANESIVSFAADQETKASGKKPITSLVNDFSSCKYDENTITNPNVIKAFLISKYETKSTESGKESENRLLVLYGCDWDIKWKEIQCPFIVYQGTVDVHCVPNMGKYMFECVSGQKAPEMSIMDCEETKEKETIVSKESRENKENECGHQPTSKITVDLNEEELEEEDMQILNNAMVELHNEYVQNNGKETAGNKQCTLVWGSQRGHLWFFEHDLWENVIFRVLFWQNKVKSSFSVHDAQ